MGDNDVDVDRFFSHVRATNTEMFDVPDDWPRNVELALIDIVLSIRARYGVPADTDVRVLFASSEGGI